MTPAQVARSIQQAAVVPRGAGGTWSAIGPSNVGARVVDLVVDPAHPDTVYGAVSGGGVWRGTDAGQTWQPSWPARLTQAMGVLAVGPDGALWAGTARRTPPAAG